MFESMERVLIDRIDDDELVAAYPCDQGRRAGAFDQPRSDFFDHSVTDGMSVLVVDGLESIDVDGGDYQERRVRVRPLQQQSYFVGQSPLLLSSPVSGSNCEFNASVPRIEKMN